MKIFVQITSYRDPELRSTIIDCIRKSKNPNNLHFGICWQHDEKEDLKEFEINPKFKIAEFSWMDSKGAGWAKSEAQKLYQGEEYTLQIDSHHRFEKDWDYHLINMLESLKSEKPILSSSAGAYRSSNNEKLSIEPYKISIAGFNEYGIPILRPDVIIDWEKKESPIKSRFLCGHYIFSKGQFCLEYEHDPELYFEEIDFSLSVRCFTMGYDLFHPTKNLLWHEYTRENRKKHWLDHNETWKEKDEISKKRTRQLLGIEDNNINLEKFGLGSVRTLRDYEIYTGIDFTKGVMSQAASIGEEPPIYKNEEEWKNGLNGVTEAEELEEYSLEVSWDIDEIEKTNDYDFWFFGFLDEDGKEIYRKDFVKERDEDILSLKINTKEVKFKSKKEPKSCVIWPHSKSRGWLTRLESSV